MKQYYPAVFEPVTEKGFEGAYNVNFPDITDHSSYTCFTYGRNFEEAMAMAADVLNLTLMEMQDEGAAIPKPSSPEQLPVKDGAFVQYIAADPEAYRRQEDNRAVRKNVTIPHWMAVAAKKNGMNLSHLLQSAISQALEAGRA